MHSCHIKWLTDECSLQLLQSVFSCQQQQHSNSNTTEQQQHLHSTTQHNCNLMQFHWHSTDCEKDPTRALIKNTLPFFHTLSPYLSPYLSLSLSVCLPISCELSKEFSICKSCFCSATKTKRRPKASRLSNKSQHLLKLPPKHWSF